MIKLEHEKINFGGLWHSDTAYLERPPMATMLIAREMPPRGGDTLFANMYLAYETLSDGMRRMLDGLVERELLRQGRRHAGRARTACATAPTDAAQEYVAEHPVVRTHPETGRKALYVNGGHALRFRT